jgi:hypothetical protein
MIIHLIILFKKVDIAINCNGELPPEVSALLIFIQITHSSIKLSIQILNTYSDSSAYKYLFKNGKNEDIDSSQVSGYDATIENSVFDKESSDDEYDEGEEEDKLAGSEKTSKLQEELTWGNK